MMPCCIFGTAFRRRGRTILWAFWERSPGSCHWSGSGIRMRRRGGAGQIPLVLEELQPYISGSVNPEQIHDRLVTRETINGFLRDLQPEARQMFVQRYWYLCSISQIAAEHRCGESKVKMSLQRSREKLKKLLEKEGIEV